MTQFLESWPDASAVTGNRSRLTRVLWWLMLTQAAGVAAYATYVFLPGTAHSSGYILALRVHIAGGVGALLTGPWQFSDRLRARDIRLHRWLGRVYLIEVAMGGLAGLPLASVSAEGMPTHIGFGLLAVLWLTTASQAYRTIRRRDVAAHQSWMIRNFSLTLAAVTLRNYIGLMFDPPRETVTSER
jgi:uncharacterized membrane protein